MNIRNSHTPTAVYPIRNDVTKSTRSELHVYGVTPRTNATARRSVMRWNEGNLRAMSPKAT